MKVKVVLSLSGGLDSSVLLATLIEKGYEVLCVMFDYGSKHSLYEWCSAQAVADHYGGIPLLHIDVRGVFKGFKSDLLKSGGEIPEGHYEDESMKRTVVPGRNMIFASILAGLAESIGFDVVAMGTHAGDHHIYPDCRPEFNAAMKRTAYFATDKKVEMYFPFQDIDKAAIVAEGIRLGAPLEKTRTCYKDQPLACGVCGSCVERRTSFSLNGIEDPTPYASHGPLPEKKPTDTNATKGWNHGGD